MLHSKGNILPFLGNARATRSAYAEVLASILRGEADQPGVSAKTLMKWTGASERTAKGWLSGDRGPSGEHLVLLIGKSDAVLAAVLRLAERDRVHRDIDLTVAREMLRGALDILEKIGS